MMYDIAIIGSGPGGHVAAEKAAHLGYKVVVIEKERLGGICLNWGCIPTKALLKSAQAYHYAEKAEEYGIEIVGEVKPNFTKIIERSRGVADTMNKGVEFLMKKSNVDVVYGKASLTKDKKIEVVSAEGTQIVEAEKIILATGAHSRVLPNLPQDGKYIIGYREAMTLPVQPKSMVVVGSGAIGSEFAHFYQSIGTQVTLVEFMPTIVPNEDKEVASTLQRCFKKNGMKVYTATSVDKVEVVDNHCVVTLSGKKTETIECDVVLSAVGVETNVADLGLENVGIEPERGKVPVNEWYETSVEGIYAIGDIVKGAALAHVASKEAEVCVKHIKGLEVKPVSYDNIPGCTYTTPEIASVGLNEDKAKEAGYDVKVGKFMYMASGKATAAGNRDGFVKVVLNRADNKILGCSMIGDNVTEMIEEIVVARENNLTAQQLIDSVHPHPTMSEAVMEALNMAINA
ncbi:MAG: dihydrolipoyl dehydrogenase [Bacteroidales bacterium]|nr:dihydrolipoyl dehydrogenase [Candidatus Scybalousia scybalohippi]MCQ2327602.1 dihydrolipoyl dehydrogenase [Bacteroidales bacterium]